MNEITRVILENEMDLILAHKQSMRLAELAGLSLAAQTTFATAVSEVSRNATGVEYKASLSLYVSDKKEKLKYIIAVLEDRRPDFAETRDEGYGYARRLVQHTSASTANGVNHIELNYRLPHGMRIDDMLIEKWRISLNTDPAVSPYEEIKRKNRQLIELADKLRESEQQYRSLTDSLPIMIFTTNLQGEVIYSNKWLEDYTGYTIEQLNSSRWKDVMHPDELEPGWKQWKDRREVTPVSRERRFRQVGTGEYRWHSGISIPIPDGDGNAASWNTFFVDIQAQKLIEETLKDNTQLKAIKAELEEKVSLLNESNQQLENFAYIASHDLQEPLRKINFYADFIDRKYRAALPAEANQFFGNLMNATERMKLLIQDVLAYSTVRREQFGTVDLNTLLAEALQDLEISIQEKQALITAGPMPLLEGNSRQLKQLFENLISNSIKFAREGVALEINISASVAGGRVTITCSDNGVGFDNKYISKMFEIFQRLHPREKYTGTGIGLAICKKIVAMHHGHLTASGVEGSGATFTIDLPLTQPEIIDVDIV